MSRPFALARSSLRIIARTLLISLVPFSLTFGCLGMKLGGNQGGDDEDSDMGGAKAGPTPDVEPGSCDAWKVSYCKAVRACNAFETYDACAERVGYVRCLDDAPFGKCQKALDAAVEKEKCEDLPKECGPMDLADRKEPVAACRSLYQAVCEWAFFCGIEVSEESCRQGLEISAPCANFTAVLPSAKKCIDAYKILGCFEPQPEICQGVLR